MDVTTKEITLAGVFVAGGFGIIALVIGNIEMAILGMTIVGTAIGVPVASNKLSNVSTDAVTTSTDAAKDTEQATSDEQATPISTDDLAAQAVDNSTSITDTTQPIVATPATDVQPVRQVTLSQETVNAIAAAMNQQNQTAQTNNASAAVAADVQPVNQQ